MNLIVILVTLPKLCGDDYVFAAVRNTYHNIR